MMRLSLFTVTVIVFLTGARAHAVELPADKLPEPALTAKGPEGDYLRALHQQVHKRWAENFLRSVGKELPATNPLNEPNRTAEVEVTIGGDGLVASIKVAKSSEFPGFDDAISEILRDSAPFPTPPVDLRSDDGALHVRWLFARDQRRCSGLSLVRQEDPLPVALPKLLRDKREAEAIKRVTLARAGGAPVDPTMNALALAWMKGTLHSPQATVRQARALADTGDRDAIKWLQGAVKRFETAQEAGRALAAHKVPVCPLVKSVFESANLADHQYAALALATAGESECAAPLIALLGNSKARPDARAAAATALGPIADEAARKALADAAKDGPPAVRAAAILAGVRPRAGRGKVIAMVTVLRDPAPEVRAAAAAGIVRAGGDSNLGDLYVVFKDDDARPAEWVARELEYLDTEESTKLLVRLLKRPHASVQLAAARVLVARQARAWFEALRPFLDGKTDAELKNLALVSADPATLARAAEDPKSGIAAYRAYLARGDRDLAAAWWIAKAPTLPPVDQAATLVDWATTRVPAGGAAPTAAKATTAKPTTIKPVAGGSGDNKK